MPEPDGDTPCIRVPCQANRCTHGWHVARRFLQDKYEGVPGALRQDEYKLTSEVLQICNSMIVTTSKKLPRPLMPQPATAQL